MLYAKINPKASFVKQENPFSAPVTVEAEFLTALARPYAAGAKETNFEVQFGNAILDEEGAIKGVQGVSSTNIILSALELENWGVDDSSMLEAVAAKLGTSVVEVVDVTSQY